MEGKQPEALSKKQLVRSFLIAIAIAVVVLLIAVLPAEYGIDPLGTGKLFGFSRLHVDPVAVQSDSLEAADVTTTPIKMEKLSLKDVGSNPDIIKPIEANNPPPSKQYATRVDTIEVRVAASRGIEYKVKVLKHGSLKYEWATTNGEILFFDFHGEVKQANPPDDVFYESYSVAYAKNMVGTFTAPFEGKHGWYFSNKTKRDVYIQLVLIGEYEQFEQ